MLSIASSGTAAELLAGAAKVDITDYNAGPVNDPLFVKALVIRSGQTTLAVVTVDAVAIGEIGRIGNDYLGKVRAQVEQELQIAPHSVFINASHCHGIVSHDADVKTVEAVRQAAKKLVPVRIGAGTGHEDRVGENRRLKLKDGREIDVRHAYSMPADEDIAEIGPIDPEIGVLRLDRLDGSTLAVVYNFACHPIQSVPSGANTADLSGFASQVIEDNLSEGTIALFVQGCGGDINPTGYKDVNHPRHGETLGNMLGLSTLKAVRKIEPRNDDRLTILNETLTLPRADLAGKIADLESEQLRLARSLGGTSLNLKTFQELTARYRLAPEFPSAYSYRYLNERKLGRDNLDQLDAANRRDLERYVRNIQIMEQLTRVNTNLRLLQKHQASAVAAGRRTLDVEVGGLRIGDFVLVTFPGELVVQIGLNIKGKSPHQPTFVAGYTNGYIYYCPTTEQLQNRGGAQEDSDCMLAPEWQAIFEKKAADLLSRL
ncbi:hypothetical protein GC176_13180 [bacterium]|nr:hypothetical protein [bacterium]